MTLKNDYWQRHIAPSLAVLAADASDQLAWAREHQVRTVAIAEEVEFSVQLAEGIAGQSTFEPEALQDLKAVGRLLDEMDLRCRTDWWADALATHASWGEVRTLARQILIVRMGEWRQPLPRRVQPQHVYD
ncbi:hypothetical protein [Streptomyces sp. NPDC059564]|uniref:hypothetical protein n=1 Tax=Streptomyces sp. NPDC059564 TaxID=3346865 RepID=UPI0036B832CF